MEDSTQLIVQVKLYCLCFLVFCLGYKSFNELNSMAKSNEFIKLFSRGTKQQVDAIRDNLKVIDINGLNQINQHIVKKVLIYN